MNLYLNIILNIIYITYPLLIYLFYVAHNKNCKKEENNIFFLFSIISSLYLIIRFNKPIISDYPLIIIDALLIVSYYKNRKIITFFLSIIFIIIFNFEYNMNLVLLIIEYLVYYLVHFSKKEKFLNKYIIIKSFFFTCNLVLIKKSFNIEFFYQIILQIIILYIITYITLLLLEKGDETIRYHMISKELEREKQIRTSLFKITHEIKNPIAVCKGYLDMFDINNPEHSIKYVPILREEIERVLIILQDFLSLTKSNINKESMDIYMLLNDVLDDVETIIKEKNIKLIVSIPDDELYINADYNRLKQVFINIIKNSIESIEQNGIIKVYTKINNNKIIIYFEDNGVGMDEEVLKKIKEPFFTTKSYGTGLGISLSDEIISAHNGKLIYESNKNVGTKAIISLLLN